MFRVSNDSAVTLLLLIFVVSADAFTNTCNWQQRSKLCKSLHSFNKLISPTRVISIPCFLGECQSATSKRRSTVSSGPLLFRKKHHLPHLSKESITRIFSNPEDDQQKDQENPPKKKKIKTYDNSLRQRFRAADNSETDPNATNDDTSSTNSLMSLQTLSRVASGKPLYELASMLRLSTGGLGIFRPRLTKIPQPLSSSGRQGEEEEEEDRGITSAAALQEIKNSKVMIMKLCGFYVGLYLIVAVISYSFVLERWSIVDSLYFAVTTFTTVGYGDVFPETAASRLFTVFFGLYGISILGIALGIIGQNVVKAQEMALQRTSERVRRRSRRRILIKRRRRMENDENDEINDKEVDPNVDSSTRKENDKNNNPNDHHQKQEQKQQEKKELEKKEQHHRLAIPSVWGTIRSLLTSQFPYITLILFLSNVIGHIENWSFGTSCYFGAITMTTIGYGDITPHTQLGKSLSLCFIPLSVSVIGELLSRIAQAYIDRETIKAERRFLERENSLTMKDLTRMDTNEDGMVSKLDFLSFMLVAMGKVDKDKIDEVMGLFGELDVDGNGVLAKDDLELIS